MRASKLGSMVALLGLVGSMAVACGDDDGEGPSGPVGGRGGSAEAGGSGDPVGGTGDAGGSGAAPAGGAGSGAGGSAGAGDAGSGAGDAGAGGVSAAPSCERKGGTTYEVGEYYVEYMDVCTCEATGDFTCADGCTPTEAEILDLFDQVKACDPDDASSCSVEITYDNFYHPACTWSVTAAGAELAKQLAPKLALLNELDCDADTITNLPCPATRSTTCLPSGICADFAE